MRRKKRQSRRQDTEHAVDDLANRGPAARPRPEVTIGKPTEDEAGARNVDPVAKSLARTRPLRHHLWIHPEVPLRLHDTPLLFQRLGLLIEQLAARGRTSVVKGCQGNNRGWLRTPLGGAHGQQYYLWWAPAGSRPMAGSDLEPGGIAIRAARHHDERTTLNGGARADYVEIDNADRMAPDIAGTPWTDAQERFRKGSEPVRVLEGSPGSGKTTALWHSIDARADEHVLYVTWSGTLAEEAAAHFESFAAPTVRTTCIDFATLLAWITGEAVTQQPLERSQLAFENAVKLAKPRKRGEWEHVDGALYAEVRAVLLGGAWTESHGAVRQDGCMKLDEHAYGTALARLRRNDELNRRTVIGTVKDLPPGSLYAIFPELAAAAGALDKLRQQKVPPRLADVNRIAIDEAQDLTLTELAVVIELARSIESLGRPRPIVLVAGDEGQTVRPSGFSWARTRDLLTKQLSRPATYALDTQLRCPKRIDDVCDAARQYYRGIEKKTRPAGQHDAGIAETGEGRILRITVGQNEIQGFIEQLNTIAGAAVITATGQVPEWVPEGLRKAVLTPAEAKGLEYQTVCVVDMARAAAAARAEAGRGHKQHTLNHEGRRAAIDRMRVALSRSTETLAVVCAENEAECSELLGTGIAIRYGTQDLLEELRAEAEGKTPEERALTLSEECRQLRDRNLSRALMRGTQALQLLGKNEDIGRTADAAVAGDVTETVLSMLTHGWLGKTWTPSEQADARAAGREASEQREGLKTSYERQQNNDHWPMIEEELLEAIISWASGETDQAVTIADRLGLLVNPGQRHWATGALQRHLPTLRSDIEAAAESAEGLGYRVPRVERWLRTLGVSNDAAAEALQLTEKAFDNAMGTVEANGHSDDAYRPLRAAQEMLATLPPDATRDGRIEEALGHYERAARCYGKGGAKRRLGTMARKHALWETAIEALEGEERTVVEWLVRIEKFANEIPDDLGSRITDAESVRLHRQVLLAMLKKLKSTSSANESSPETPKKHHAIVPGQPHGENAE